MQILLGIDDISPDNNALAFACYLGGLARSKVTGVFLENLEPEERTMSFQEKPISWLFADNCSLFLPVRIKILKDKWRFSRKKL